MAEFTFISSLVGEEWEPLTAAVLVAGSVFLIGCLACL